MKNPSPLLAVLYDLNGKIQEAWHIVQALIEDAEREQREVESLKAASRTPEVRRAFEEAEKAERARR